MRVPVLVVLPGQDVLRASARAAVEGSRPVALTKVKKPSKLRIDTRFTALPLGSGQPKADASLESIEHPKPPKRLPFALLSRRRRHKTFPRRARVMRSSPTLISQTSSPVSAAVPSGTTALLPTNSTWRSLRAKNLDGSDVALAILDTGINLQHLTSKLGWDSKARCHKLLDTSWHNHKARSASR